MRELCDKSCACILLPIDVTMKASRTFCTKGMVIIAIAIGLRRQKLVKILNATMNGMPISVEKIAHILGVSERAVRYDLEAVCDELQNRGYRLCKKAQKGVWLEKDDRRVLDDSCQCTVNIPGKEERIHAIVIYLLQVDHAQVADVLAKKVGVSRSTLQADLKGAMELLKQYPLKIQSQKGLGLWIEGEEFNKRKILIDIFSRSLHDFGRPMFENSRLSHGAALFQAYTEALPVREIAEYFIALTEKKRIHCYDVSLNYMVVALLVQLQRLKMKHVLAQFGGAECRNHLLSALADDVISFMSRYHTAFSMKGEKEFMAHCLLSGKIYIPETETKDVQEDEAVNLKALKIARRFIEDCQVWLGDIYLDDEELIYNLALHLQPAVRRAKYGIELANPLLPQIRQKYANLFEIADRAVKGIEKELKIKISDDEIGYLVIHLGAAAERKKLRNLQQLRAVLVCGNGIGTASLLAMTLKNRLQCLNIEKILPAYKLEPKQLKGIDLVISTIPLSLDHTAVLHVSPILSEAEVKVVESQIQHLFHRKFSLKGHSMGTVNVFPGFYDVLTPACIALDVEAASWEEAVQAAGTLLVKAGAVEPCYVQSMIDCVKRMGPYIVIGPGLAMPHARPEDGVNRVCLSMVRLENPVSFGHAVHDPIDLVFAFGTMDEQVHLNVLCELWEFFQSESALRCFRTCQNGQALLRSLKAVCLEKSMGNGGEGSK